MTLRIVTEFVHPPIPDRRFDWAATLDNYEPGCPSGSGRTEAEAIKDLLDLLDENDNGTTCKDKGGYVGPRGECLVCGADQGVACRGPK